MTISEALRKKLPVFIHSYLPGQEKINLSYLKEQRLVFELSSSKSLELQLDAILKNTEKMDQLEQSIDAFQQQLEMEMPEHIIDVMNWVIDTKAKHMPLQPKAPSIQLRAAQF